jgi:hypothetical protein
LKDVTTREGLICSELVINILTVYSGLMTTPHGAGWTMIKDKMAKQTVTPCSNFIFV